MLAKLTESISPALAFAVFLWIFAKTQATHLEPDADVGDGGDMCQCGPRCAGYVEEHICARCCTSIMRRRRSTNHFFSNYAFGRGSTRSSGGENVHAHRKREHSKFSREHHNHNHNHNHNQINYQQQQQEQKPHRSSGFWRCSLFKICPANHRWHSLPLALAIRLRTIVRQRNTAAQIDYNPMQ